MADGDIPNNTGGLFREPRYKLNCASCKWFFATDNSEPPVGNGNCQRFPQFVTKTATTAPCGEWNPRNEGRSS
jgi:hypothetical protein